MRLATPLTTSPAPLGSSMIVPLDCACLGRQLRACVVPPHLDPVRDLLLQATDASLALAARLPPAADGRIVVLISADGSIAELVEVVLASGAGEFEFERVARASAKLVRA